MISKISSSSSPRGKITALADAFVGFAPTNAHSSLRWLLRSLVLSTSTIARKSNTGQNSALQSANVYRGRMLAFFYVSLATH